MAPAALHIGGRILDLLPKADQKHPILINRTLKPTALVEDLAPLVVLVAILLLWWIFKRCCLRLKAGMAANIQNIGPG